jgi:hypothetical protein
LANIGGCHPYAGFLITFHPHSLVYRLIAHHTGNHTTFFRAFKPNQAKRSNPTTTDKESTPTPAASYATGSSTGQTTYHTIHPLTPLEDLDAFLKDHEFALVTDEARKWVLGVATRSDLEVCVRCGQVFSRSIDCADPSPSRRRLSNDEEHSETRETIPSNDRTCFYYMFCGHDIICNSMNIQSFDSLAADANRALERFETFAVRASTKGSRLSSCLPICCRCTSSGPWKSSLSTI